ncbi:MAG: long-chain fatty acid--CoA ligase [Gammaproteobacteria bacterium]|nr:long-chain fatty acid--CoA ligase [Gammaproteobacteria bacterium]
MPDLPRDYPTVVHMLLDAAARAPDREALVCGEDRLSYTEYLRCVAGLAQELDERGARGGRVALVMGNSVDICIASFAVHMAGAQLTPLNPLYTENELGPMLDDADVSVLIHDDAVSTRVAGLIRRLSIEQVIAVGGPDGRRLTEWRAGADLTPPQPLPLAESPGTLQFTGGTTGRSKGADLSHRALAINISQREALVPNRPDVERMLCVMPLFHCYASHMCLHAMAYARGALVVMPRYHPDEVIRLLHDECITLLGAAPTLLTGLLNYPAFTGQRFPLLTRTYSGSAPLPEEVIHRWESLTGTIVIEGYGQSEAGPVISFNPVAGPRKAGSVGVAVPDEDLQIVDMESGNRVLPAGQQGEIRIRGPHLMSGYRNRPDETAGVLRDGWLYTGDIGELDDDRYLFIRGRKKEMIIVSGYNVFPREVEEVLHAHPNVREAAVVGRPDDYRGELPVAFVAARAGADLSAVELTRHCAGSLAPYKVPAAFNIVAELPKTAVGKVDKLALAARVRLT